MTRESQLSDLLAADAAGTLDGSGEDELGEILNARLRMLDPPQPPAPWDQLWRKVRAQRDREARLMTLSISGLCASLAALGVFAFLTRPASGASRVIVFGGLAIALAGFAWSLRVAMGRSARLGELSVSSRGELWTAVRADLDRQIRTIRYGGSAVLTLLVAALLALSSLPGTGGTKFWFVVGVGVCVVAVLIRDRVVLLPRLLRERAVLDT